MQTYWDQTHEAVILLFFFKVSLASPNLQVWSHIELDALAAFIFTPERGAKLSFWLYFDKSTIEVLTATFT